MSCYNYRIEAAFLYAIDHGLAVSNPYIKTPLFVDREEIEKLVAGRALYKKLFRLEPLPTFLCFYELTRDNDAKPKPPSGVRNYSGEYPIVCHILGVTPISDEFITYKSIETALNNSTVHISIKKWVHALVTSLP